MAKDISPIPRYRGQLYVADDEGQQLQLDDVVLYKPMNIMARVTGYAWLRTTSPTERSAPKLLAYDLDIGISALRSELLCCCRFELLGA